MSHPRMRSEQIIAALPRYCGGIGRVRTSTKFELQPKSSKDRHDRRLDLVGQKVTVPSSLLLSAMAGQLVDDSLVDSVACQTRNEAMAEYVPAPQVLPFAVMVQGLGRERLAFD